METLLHIISLILIGACIGACTMFIEWTFGEPYNEAGVSNGRIFSAYGRWIRKGFEREENKILLNINDGNPHTKLNYWKALGMCYYCFNVYVCFALSVVFISSTPLEWWGIIITIPVSHYTCGYLYQYT